jgi:hypothetical protein
MQPSPNLASPQRPAPAPASLPPHHGRWLHRTDLFLRIMLHLYLGIILFFWPWTEFWNSNHLLLYFAPVARIAATGAARGLVSGLGLLNLWIAISDAIHYKES